MTPIFIPHPEIPNHWTVSSKYFIRTTDLDQEEFRFSRVVEDNFIEGRGFKAFQQPTRVYVYGYHRPRCSEEDYFDIGDTACNELLSLIEKGTLTLIHYGGCGCVTDIVTGVQMSTLMELPDSFKSLYYNPL